MEEKELLPPCHCSDLSHAAVVSTQSAVFRLTLLSHALRGYVPPSLTFLCIRFRSTCHTCFLNALGMPFVVPTVTHHDRNHAHPFPNGCSMTLHLQLRTMPGHATICVDARRCMHMLMLAPW